MCGLWAGLVLAGVSPFMPCSSCSQIERSLLFFCFLSTNPSPALLLREESPLICYLTVGSKQVHKQKENRLADSEWLTKKIKPWFRIRQEIARSPPWHFFQATISNLCHQKSVKKVKKCKKVKVKAFFFSRWPNRWRLPSLLDRLSQKSRLSLIEPWFGGLLRLSLGKTSALSFFQEMLS